MRRFSDIISAGLIAVSVMLAACSESANEDLPPGWTSELAAEIEGKCGLPAGTLTGQTLLSAASREDTMPKIACALKEARERNVNVGFISNPIDPGA
jgi:hypothetical protein